MAQVATANHAKPRLYDDEGDALLEADRRADRVILLPSGDPRKASTDRDRIRIQWGQHLLADLLGRPAPTRFGPFQVVTLDNDISLDFYESDKPIHSQHYAFLIDEETFDAVFSRMKAQGLPYWADPGKSP